MQFSWTRAAGTAVCAALLTLPGALTAVAQHANPYGSVVAQHANPFHQQGNPAPRYANFQASSQPPVAQQRQNPYRLAAVAEASQRKAAVNPAQATELISPAPPSQITENTLAAPDQNYSATASHPVGPAANSPSPYGMNSCGTGYNTFVGGGKFYENNYGGSNCGGCGGCGGCGSRWFGGIYGLVMERAGEQSQPLAFSSASGTGAYPTDGEYVLNLDSVSRDTYGGLEIRLGAVLGGRGCGTVDNGCGPRIGVEGVYWYLQDNSQTTSVTDATGGNRLHSMIDYRGLEFDPGTGSFRPVNHYYDYAPPISDYTDDGSGTPLDRIEVRGLTVRNQFSVQNLEFNLLRLPCITGGCCGVGGNLGSQSYCGPRYTLSCLLGFRYTRLDEDFLHRTDFETFDADDLTAPPIPGSLTHTIDVDNHLTGVQLGGNGVYHLGQAGRWAVYCNTAVGVYNNQMEVGNRMSGTVRYESGATFNLQSTASQVATIGELRLGGSYRCNSHCRLTAGYRLLGISGVAIAYEQLATSYSTPAQNSLIDGHGSIFLHGLQAGLEFNY